MEQPSRIFHKKLKWLKSLRMKKSRVRSGYFLAEGNKLVHDLIQAGLLYQNLYIMDPAEKELFPDGELISMRDRKMFTNFDHPAGAAAVFELPPPGNVEELLQQDFVLALYMVRDPGNLGTILRTAAWFGHTYVLLLNGCADPFNPKAVQASMGAIGHLHIVQQDVGILSDMLKIGFEIHGAEMEGQSLYSYKWPKKSLLVMGNEGAGLSEFPEAYKALSIPAGKGAGVESLNVAMATGIFLSHQAAG